MCSEKCKIKTCYCSYLFCARIFRFCYVFVGPVVPNWYGHDVSFKHLLCVVSSVRVPIVDVESFCM